MDCDLSFVLFFFLIFSELICLTWYLFLLAFCYIFEYGFDHAPCVQQFLTGLEKSVHIHVERGYQISLLAKTPVNTQLTFAVLLDP